LGEDSATEKSKSRKEHEMSNRKLISLGLFVFLFAVFNTTAAHSKDHHGKTGGFDLEKKVLHKMHLAISNQEELALSEDQCQKIKTLKIATKKDLIKRKAEIDLLSIDMKSKLGEDPLDVEGLNTIIDQKYDKKKAKTKALVEAYAKFKAILTDEQKKKLKKICSKSPKK
jgi:Spy/CpxP family protein refolding chaperone